MDIISLLITIAGILIILGLYILGRLSRSKMPREKPIASVPNIVDDNGERFTSVLDDIPATDGSTPQQKPLPEQTTNTVTPGQTKQTDKNPQASTAQANKTAQANNTAQAKNAAQANNAAHANTPPKQHVLFVSAKDGKGLDGNKISKALPRLGLSFGEFDIFHYQLETTNGKTSLFRVANGVEPWTLTEKDLKNQSIPGLSMLLITPTPIDDREAVETFIKIAGQIATELNGELKNQQQQLFTEKDRLKMLEEL